MPMNPSLNEEELWIPSPVIETETLVVRYRKQLLRSVIPFWLQHAIDPTDGAINTCLSIDGIVASRDRFIWSQARALWTFSAVYHRVENRPVFLKVADGLFSYLLAVGKDNDEEWVYRVDQYGEPIEGAISWFTAGFAIYGLVEYFRASGNKEAVKLAHESYLKIRDRIRSPEGYKLLYPLPNSELLAHSLFMMFGLAFLELGDALEDKEIIQDATYCGDLIYSKFLDQETGLIFEYRALNEHQASDPLTKVIIPGHAIESLWFLGHLFKKIDRLDLIPEIVQSVKRHLDFGWDEEYGGIFLALTSDKTRPDWLHWDSKPWWIAVEALYALVFCSRESSDQWVTDWFVKVQRYAYEKYPHGSSGEWNQKLDRLGKPTKANIGLPVIDPFHLPRSLILSIDALTGRSA